MIIAFVVGVLLFAFWIWMLVDCVLRKFRNTGEKIAWIVIIALTSWIGALIYFILIKAMNPHGLFRKHK